MVNDKKAMEVLKESGYFVDNLWMVDDVKHKFDCTEEEAQMVLTKALTSHETMKHINNSISEFGELMKLKEKD